MTKLWNPFFNKASPFELINLSCLRGKIENESEKESLRLKCAIRGSRKKRERERDKINGDKIGSKRPVLDLVRVATCYGGDTGNFAITRSHEYIYIYIRAIRPTHDLMTHHHTRHEITRVNEGCVH